MAHCNRREPYGLKYPFAKRAGEQIFTDFYLVYRSS